MRTTIDLKKADTNSYLQPKGHFDMMHHVQIWYKY